MLPQYKKSFVGNININIIILHKYIRNGKKIMRKNY